MAIDCIGSLIIFIPHCSNFPKVKRLTLKQEYDFFGSPHPFREGIKTLYIAKAPSKDEGIKTLYIAKAPSKSEA